MLRVPQFDLIWFDLIKYLISNQIQIQKFQIKSNSNWQNIWFDSKIFNKNYKYIWFDLIWFDQIKFKSRAYLIQSNSNISNIRFDLTLKNSIYSCLCELSNQLYSDYNTCLSLEQILCKISIWSTIWIKYSIPINHILIIQI